MQTAIQDDYIEADPLANMPRGLVLFTGSERSLHSHPDSPPPQSVLEIRLWGSGLSIHGPPFWAFPGSPHFYEVHGCGSFSTTSQIDMAKISYHYFFRNITISRFFVMLILLLCLSSGAKIISLLQSQILSRLQNIKNVWWIFRPKWGKIKICVIILSLLLK